MAVNANGGPHQIPPVPEDGTEGTLFENAIRRIGVETACEWFGHYPNDEFTKAAIADLVKRSERANK